MQVVALEDDSASPEDIEEGLREVLTDALTILRAMLWRDGLEQLFADTDFFGSLIGACELNNLTVEIERCRTHTQAHNHRRRAAVCAAERVLTRVWSLCPVPDVQSRARVLHDRGFAADRRQTGGGGGVAAVGRSDSGGG